MTAPVTVTYFQPSWPASTLIQLKPKETNMFTLDVWKMNAGLKVVAKLQWAQQYGGWGQTVSEGCNQRKEHGML